MGIDSYSGGSNAPTSELPRSDSNTTSQISEDVDTLQTSPHVLMNRRPPRKTRKALLWIVALPVLVLIAQICSTFTRRQKAVPSPHDLTTPQTTLPIPNVDWDVVLNEDSDHIKIFKSEISPVVQKLESSQEEHRSPRAAQAMKLIAMAVTDGESEELIGQDIRLVHRTTDTLSSGSNVYRVKRFLGEGANSLILEVQDSTTRKKLALRFLIWSEHPQSWNTRPGPQKRDPSSAIAHSTEMMQLVCGDTPPHAAALENGIALSRSIASVLGMRDAVRGDEFSVTSTVGLMDRVSVDLGRFLLSKPVLVTGCKAYLARRVLKTVLKLQHAGVSHNQIHSSSFFFLEDGATTLLEFEASARFGAPVHLDLPFITLATEPDLVSELEDWEKYGKPPLAHPKSDMWSLGVVLYQIMMNSQYPYSMTTPDNTADLRSYIKNVLKKVNPDSLRFDMENVGVNRRWQELICRLLAPDRNERIGAEEVVSQYQDLLTSRAEVEVLESEAFYELYKKNYRNTEQSRQFYEAYLREKTDAHYAEKNEKTNSNDSFDRIEEIQRLENIETLHSPQNVQAPEMGAGAMPAFAPGSDEKSARPTIPRASILDTGEGVSGSHSRAGGGTISRSYSSHKYSQDAVKETEDLQSDHLQSDHLRTFLQQKHDDAAKVTKSVAVPGMSSRSEGLGYLLLESLQSRGRESSGGARMSQGASHTDRAGTPVYQSRFWNKNVEGFAEGRSPPKNDKMHDE